MRRRDLIRGYMARGLRIIEIVEFLSQKKGKDTFFPLTFTEKQKLAIVKQDIEQINKESREEYSVSKQDSDSAMVEYLERMQLLYVKALGDSEWDTAGKFAKDIARAKGVPVDEVVRVEADVTKFMRQAFQMAKERQQLNAPVQPLRVVVESRPLLPEELPSPSHEENEKARACYPVTEEPSQDESPTGEQFDLPPS